MPKWINSCPKGHPSFGGDGQCSQVDCAHCDPIVKKPTRTGDGKAPDGRASIGGPRASRRPQGERGRRA